MNATLLRTLDYIKMLLFSAKNGIFDILYKYFPQAKSGAEIHVFWGLTYKKFMRIFIYDDCIV